MTIPMPENEAERLASLEGLQIDFAEPAAEIEALCRLAAEIAKAPITLLSLITRDEQRFAVNIGLDGVDRTPRDVAFCAHAIMSDEQMVVPDATKDPRFADNPLVTGAPDIRAYAGTVLQPDPGQRIGTLCVIDRRPRELSHTVLRQLDVIGSAVSALLAAHRDKLELASLAREHKADAEVDKLTGLLNQETFWERFGDSMFEAPSGTLMVLDVDHFKAVNDACGHPLGDAFLQMVSGALTAALPKDAVIGRIGGDEFAAYLPSMVRERETTRIIGALRDTLRKGAARLDPPQTGEVSIGVAQHPRHGTVAGELYERADLALYAAKSAGRDEVCWFTEKLERQSARQPAAAAWQGPAPRPGARQG